LRWPVQPIERRLLAAVDRFEREPVHRARGCDHDARRLRGRPGVEGTADLRKLGVAMSDVVALLTVEQGHAMPLRVDIDDEVFGHRQPPYAGRARRSVRQRTRPRVCGSAQTAPPPGLTLDATPDRERNLAFPEGPCNLLEMPLNASDADHPPPAFYHEESAAVRFWVPVEGQPPVGAIISKLTLHYRFRPGATNDDPLETYRSHAQQIDATVRRRVAGGSIEPVMVREYDLRDLRVDPAKPA
jgi:hypothetical protein